MPTPEPTKRGSGAARVARVVLVGCLPLAIAGAGWLAMRRPSNDRDWSPDQTVTPWAEWNGDLVTVHGVRDFRYRSTTDWDARWEDRTYDLRRIERGWFVVEPFSDFAGAAHTFVSFEFDDDTYVAISVEIRKERGESFSALKGLLRTYELMYVVGDERDLVGLRANHRRDDVFMYPMRANPTDTRALFESMLRRATTLRDEPEFYNTFLANCTTEIVDQVNVIAPSTVPFSRKVVFPGYSDELAWELGLIDTTLPLEELRRHFRVNDAAAAWADAPDFSLRIREGL